MNEMGQTKKVVKMLAGIGPGPRLRVLKDRGKVFVVLDTVARRVIIRGSRDECERAAGMAGSQLELFPDTGWVCPFVPRKAVAHA